MSKELKNRELRAMLPDIGLPEPGWIDVKEPEWNIPKSCGVGKRFDLRAGLSRNRAPY
tara:strand:+ start:467 stop:640 length:174 start_codon:yes stop_codon:yes gene_type:complete